jgi:hypothetical protein
MCNLKCRKAKNRSFYRWQKDADCLQFQTQEPADAKYGKAQVMKHVIHPALSVKDIYCRNFPFALKCYNKSWCIITQRAIRTSAPTEPHDRGHTSSQHGKSTWWWQFLDTQTSGVSGQCSCPAYELIRSYSWVDVRTLHQARCSCWLHVMP